MEFRFLRSKNADGVKCFAPVAVMGNTPHLLKLPS